MPTRTTLTLDDDVAAGLTRLARASGRPFRRVVNDALRAGMQAEGARPAEPFEVDPKPLHLRPGLRIDSISELIDQVEGPAHP